MYPRTTNLTSKSGRPISNNRTAPRKHHICTRTWLEKPFLAPSGIPIPRLSPAKPPIPSSFIHRLTPTQISYPTTIRRTPQPR
jgi:hypothetical protein